MLLLAVVVSLTFNRVPRIEAASNYAEMLVKSQDKSRILYVVWSSVTSKCSVKWEVTSFQPYMTSIPIVKKYREGKVKR